MRIRLAFLGVILIVQTAIPADANDLMRLYRLALTRDTTLEAAKHQRDAAVEARPQALSQWTARHDIEFNVSPMFILLQYQAQYYRAVNAYDQARYSYLANVLLLKQQAGRLAEQDLAMIGSLLVTAGSGECT